MIIAIPRLNLNVSNLNNSTSTIRWQKKQEGQQIIWTDERYGAEISGQWFEPTYWQNQQAVVGTSKGRYTTHFVRHQSEENDVTMVLRHYYRGGMIRHFNRDKFLYSGLESCRSIKELKLLKYMVELDLPVPKPVAGRVTRHAGLWYSNDILIELIKDAKDGFNHLLNAPLPEETWEKIGKVIKQFHLSGIYHADLNIHNILISNQLNDIYLIDFDRCEQRAANKDWQDANLQRLKRSLDKELGLHKTFNFKEQDWQCLMAGYRE